VTAQRTQIQADEASDPEKLRRVLNEALLEMATRLEALEAVRGLTILPEILFEVGSAYSPTAGVFSMAGGGVRITCPFSPTGLVLLSLVKADGGQDIIANACDVKWHFAAGPGAGTGVLHVDFVTGLSVNTRYRMRVGVTRA
jgi:hypothetical protein